MYKKIYNYLFPSPKEKEKRKIQSELDFIMTEVMHMNMSVTDDLIRYVQELENKLRELENE